MLKILVGINTLTDVQQMAYSNHAQFFYRLGQLMWDRREYQVILNTPRRMSIDNMRNMSAKVALDNECDWLIFIDDDVLLPPDAFEKLMFDDADFDCAAGVTLVRGYPYAPMIFDWKREHSHFVWDYQSKANEKGLIFCDALGCSFTAIRVEMLKKLKENDPDIPFFKTTNYCTEDVFFFKRLRDVYPEARICANVNIHTAHILGPEIITPENRLRRMDYDTLDNPDIRKNHSEKDPAAWLGLDENGRLSES